MHFLRPPLTIDKINSNNMHNVKIISLKAPFTDEFDGVPAILHYRSSDLYLADSKETMMVEVGNNHDYRFLLK